MELIVENFIFHEILGKLNSKESGIWSFIEIHKKKMLFFTFQSMEIGLITKGGQPAKKAK